MEHATRPLTESRTSGDLRRRLVRHHLPLALASAVILVLFMSLPRFDASKYAQADIFSGTFPRDFPAGQTGQHGGGQTGPMQQGGGRHQPPQQGGGHQPPQQHGEGQAPSVSPSAEEVEDRSLRRRLTTATGYIALALLALTLLIGPANLLLRRRNPVSSYLRRDVGAWTALFSAGHVVVSLTVHGSGQISHFLDFFVADGSPLRNSFGLATADDVDQAFAGMIIGHHTGAIRMARLAEEKAGHDELKTLAGNIIAAQQREIDALEQHAMGEHG